MKVLGLICEYNPLHNGHIYHIQEALRKYAADCVAVVMSGDYVQRGEPAVADKFTRAGAALACGVDLIAELPAFYVLSSAEIFAKGAVSVLNALSVNSICFGSECNDLKRLQKLAAFFISDTQDYRKLLKENLAEGNSFAKARCNAVTALLGDDWGNILKQPNNILGIEYIKTIMKENMNITPLTIARAGNGYNSLSSSGNFLSASGIRKALEENEQIHSYIPYPTRKYLEEYQNRSWNRRFIDVNDFTYLLFYKLSTALFNCGSNKKEFIQYIMRFIDITPDLAAAIFNQAIKWYSGSTDFSFLTFAETVKTKNFALSRIKRILLRFILDFDKEKCALYERLPYIKILGFNDKGRALLKSINKSASIPLITKTANYKDLVSMDIHAANIYNAVYKMQHGIYIPNDYKQTVIFS